jgi:hypothetical protein
MVGAGLGFGQADPGHFRVGKSHPGHHPVVNLFAANRYQGVAGRQSTVIGGHVGKEIPSNNIPDSVNMG